MKTISAYLALIAVLIAVAVVWERYSYRECMRVGHTKFYCVMHIGK